MSCMSTYQLRGGSQSPGCVCSGTDTASTSPIRNFSRAFLGTALEEHGPSRRHGRPPSPSQFGSESESELYLKRGGSEQKTVKFKRGVYVCLLGIERHMRIRKAGVDIPPALIPALITELEAVRKKIWGACRTSSVPRPSCEWPGRVSTTGCLAGTMIRGIDLNVMAAPRMR